MQIQHTDFGLHSKTYTIVLLVLATARIELDFVIVSRLLHHFIFFITFKQARFLYTRLERVACINTLVYLFQ
jgi:hypothetical protein